MMDGLDRKYFKGKIVRIFRDNYFVIDNLPLLKDEPTVTAKIPPYTSFSNTNEVKEFVKNNLYYQDFTLGSLFFKLHQLPKKKVSWNIKLLNTPVPTALEDSLYLEDYSHVHIKVIDDSIKVGPIFFKNITWIGLYDLILDYIKLGQAGRKILSLIYFEHLLGE